MIKLKQTSLALSIFILSGIFLVSCHSKEAIPPFITIKGDIKNFATTKVYLTEAHEWGKFLDSADVINGKFTFYRKTSPLFIPFMVSICYYEKGQLKKLNFKNTVLSPDLDSVKYVTDAFYLEKGESVMTGDLKDSVLKYLIISNMGIQTKAFFKTQMVNFGFIDNNDPTIHKKQIENTENWIKEFPQSYYFLESIFGNRDQFSSDELQSIIKIFNKELQESKPGKALLIYAQNKKKINNSLTNIKGLNIIHNKQNIIDSTYQFNLLSFWASWCVPCKAEIPILREIYSKALQRKKLKVTSISIDENEKAWKDGLRSERMEWNQLWIEPKELSTVQSQFDFFSIPCIILTDNKGKILKKFIGFSKETEEELRAIFQI